jgi:hypothetical protein
LLSNVPVIFCLRDPGGKWLALWKQDAHGTKNAVDRGIELQCSLNETMMAADLNDYALFAEVVTHGGFAAAGRG